MENVNFIDEVSIEDLDSDNWILTSNKILNKIKTIEKRGVPLNKIAKFMLALLLLPIIFIFSKA